MFSAFEGNVRVRYLVLVEDGDHQLRLLGRNHPVVEPLEQNHGGEELIGCIQR